MLSISSFRIKIARSSCASALTRVSCAPFHSTRVGFSEKAEAVMPVAAVKEEYVPFKLTDLKDMHSSPKQHWKVERVVASIMMPSFALGIFVDNMLLDAVIAATTVAHCHWGMEQVFMDYLHPRKHTTAGPIVNKMLLLTTGLTAIGLAYLIVFDQGLTLTVKQLMHA